MSRFVEPETPHFLRRNSKIRKRGDFGLLPDFILSSSCDLSISLFFFFSILLFSAAGTCISLVFTSPIAHAVLAEQSFFSHFLLPSSSLTTIVFQDIFHSKSAPFFSPQNAAFLKTYDGAFHGAVILRCFQTRTDTGERLPSMDLLSPVSVYVWKHLKKQPKEALPQAPSSFQKGLNFG